MNTMTAIAIQDGTLVPVQLPLPVPVPGQLLIRVKAAGVNRPDVLQRKGGYPPPPGAPATPGLEIAGEIVGLGDGVKRYEVGEKVCALVPGGGYAEYAVAHEDNALPVPPGFSMVEAAAIPETFFTVWTNVFDRGGLQPGETLLVHGGSSGIGTTAILLAKALGSRVIVTAGSDGKCQACLDLGADQAINYKTHDFVTEIKGGADVILDMVGGDYLARNLKVAAMHARIVQIAFQKGSKIDIDLLPIMMKRLTLTGSTLRPRSVAEKAEIARALEDIVWPLFAKGECKPIIFKTFPLKEAAAAHALMESSAHIGKIILKM